MISAIGAWPAHGHLPAMTFTESKHLDRQAAIEKLRGLVIQWNVREDELSDVSAEVIRQREARRRIVVHQLRQLVQFWDITEIELKRPSRPRRSAVSQTVKYRHPVTGETWSGMGPQPGWLKTALVRDGYRVEDLRVEVDGQPEVALAAG